MADAQDIDVEQIMQQVRENIRSRRPGPASSGLTHPSSEAQMAADLAHTRVMAHLMGWLAVLDEQQRQMRVEGLSQQAQALTALEARQGGV